MPNGDKPYVGWDWVEKHLKERDVDRDTLHRLDAEVMGDEQTGRLSLRAELGEKVDRMNGRIAKVGGSIIGAILVKYILDWLNFFHSAANAATK